MTIFEFMSVLFLQIMSFYICTYI